jgi:predicted DNA binding protein
METLRPSRAAGRKNATLAPAGRIDHRIIVIRGDRVLLDADLAELYGVAAKRLNEQVRRNLDRFPGDFMFQLTDQELRVLRSQIATSNEHPPGRGGRRYAPYAFTEHGALMAATILNSPRAVEVSVYVVRAFVRLREVLASHKDLAKTLEELEKKTEVLALKHDQLATSTRAQFREVIEALRALMSPPEPKKRPIGFVTPKEK